MAWYDRIGKIASGVVDLGGEVVELGIDVVKAPFVEDEYEGIGNTILGIMQDNVIGGVLSSAIGPEGALGSAIGALPEEIRAPVRSFNNEVLGRVDAWQDAYIERPLAAAVMGYHLATSSGLSGWADTDTWTAAWRIADEGLPPGEYDLSSIPENQQELFTKGLSLGRAVAFATMGTDVLNPQLAAEAAQSSTFNLISGAVDFGETLILDPLLWAGKPLQAARAGKLVVRGSTATDTSQLLRRTKRADLSPKYSLVPQTGGKFGATFKLTPGQVANFTSRRADEVIKSDNWGKLNGYIARNLGRVPEGSVDDVGELSDATVAARLADENDSLRVGTQEYDELMDQRASEIRRLVGEKNMDQDTALGLAQATNETMRSNHYRYMMGDHAAGREAAEAAMLQAERMRALRGDVDSAHAPFGSPSAGGVSLLDQIEVAATRVETARRKYKRRQKDHESKKQRGQKVDAENHEKKIREELEELHEALAQKDELVGRARESLQGDADDWDFGFIMDLKTRFDDAQIDNLAARREGAYGRSDLEDFISRNLQPEDADLLDLAVDRWLLDSLGPLDDLARGVDNVLRDGATRVIDESRPDRLTSIMRERKTLTRQIYDPMSNKARKSISGVSARVVQGVSKVAPPRAVVAGQRVVAAGKRQIQMFTENTTQRYINTDDVTQSTNQFERMIRDVQRAADGQLMDADEAGRLLSQWGKLERGDQRLAMFQSVVEELNKRFADVAGADDVNGLRNMLTEQYSAANQMLRQGKPSGGRFGPGRSKVTYRDRDGNVTSVDMPLSTRQLASTLIVPRYDLLDEAWKAARPGGTASRRLTKILDESGITRVKKGAVDAADYMMAAWRPAVLLRPAWPMRVVGDEALRVMSVVGALPQLRAMVSGMKDMRVELMRRRGIDVEGLALRRMRDELELPSNATPWEVYQKYGDEFGEDAITKIYTQETNKAWGAGRRARGMAWRSGLGWALLGPLGAVGAATVSAATSSRTARRLAQRQIGETFGASLRRKADEMIETAAREITDPEEAQRLRDAANLLLTRERNLKRVLKKYNIDREDQISALTVADAAGARLEEAGRSPTMIGGVLVRNAVGEDSLSAETIQSRVSADRSTQSLVAGASGRARESLDSAFWDEIGLTADNVDEFAQVWERSMNMQWKAGAGDSYTDRYLAQVWDNSAATMDEYKRNLLAFLQTSDGRKVLEDLRVPNSESGLMGFVDAVADTTNTMLPQFDLDGARFTSEFGSFREHLGKGLEGDVTWAQVAEARSRLTPEQLDFVDDARNGLGMNLTVGQVASAQTPNWKGTSQLMQFTNDAFNVLATLPTDNLSRLPFFRASYDAEVARRLSAYVDPETGAYILEGKDLQKIIDRVEASARETALEDVRYLLYDLTEKTRTQETMANMMPFLGAWQEVISRWGNIAKENPAYVSRVLDNFNSIPVAEDDEGNRWMVWRFPTVLEEAGMSGPLLRPFSGQNLKFSQDAMSMLSSGGPGFGPLITIPITEIAVQEPELEEALEFIWPYGLPQGTSTSDRVVGQFMPAWMKRAKGVVAGSDELERLVLQVARDRMMAHRTAEPIGDGNFPNRYAEIMADPQSQNQFMADIREDARALLAARAFASTTLPTSMMVASPYQFYLDQYRELRKKDPLNADDRFIEEFGNEFFSIVQRTTKTNNGVSPTIESWEEFKKYQPLIESYPEIGALVTGVAGSDTTQRFNEAVYRRQQSESVSPGSPDKQRERVPLEDFIEGPDIKEGWLQYRQMIDVRNAELQARAQMGASKSLNAKSNIDVREWYQFEMDRLQQEYPAWYRTFSVTDKLKDTRKLAALRAVVSDPTLSLRPEIQDLEDYFADRQIVIDELKFRAEAGGSKSLSASSNADVAEWWEYQRMEYRDIEEFKDLFDRYLSRDQVDEVTWSS